MSVAISATVSAYNGFDYEWDITPEAGWLFGMTFALCIIFFVIWFIIFIAIAIWVYKDAEKRGSSGALWLIIVIITGIIGIIIWLIIRPKKIMIVDESGRAIKQQTIVQTKEREIETFDKMITKTIKCPACGETQEVQGILGERGKVTCKKCNSEVVFYFR